MHGAGGLADSPFSAGTGHKHSHSFSNRSNVIRIGAFVYVRNGDNLYF